MMLSFCILTDYLSFCIACILTRAHIQLYRFWQENKTICDAEIIVTGEDGREASFAIHRVIMCGCSPYLKALLTNQMKESREVSSMHYKIGRRNLWQASCKKKSKTVSIFHFSFEVFAKVCVSPELFEAGSDIHTIVTYDHKTHFDVHNNKFGLSVWPILSIEVKTLETQNRKQNFLDIYSRFNRLTCVLTFKHASSLY